MLIIELLLGIIAAIAAIYLIIGGVTIGIGVLAIPLVALILIILKALRFFKGK